MEEFTKRHCGHLKESIHRAVSEAHVADTQRSELELPAPVLVGAPVLGGALAKNDDDLTFASFAVRRKGYARITAG